MSLALTVGFCVGVECVLLPKVYTGCNASYQQYVQQENKKQEQIILSFDKVFCQDTFITDKRLINFIKKELNVIDFRTVNKWKSFLKTVGLIEKEPREKKWTNIAPMDIMTILNDSIVEVES